jgi:HAE1 family hydrophobic/amphiphilic exporter-1
MNLAKLSISRHVLAASFSLVIILLGVLSYTRIGVDRNPDVEFPTLSISTSLPGASPETVSQTVTQPIESRLNTIAGIDTLVSSSVTGLSAITVTFDTGTDMAEALNDVQSRISQARRELPTDAEPSVVQKFDVNASPIMWITLSGSRPELELAALAKMVQKRIEPTSGVGEVRLRGAADRVLRITVNDATLTALALTYADIEAAFTRDHVNAGGGRLKTSGREYQVELDFEYATPEQLRELAITETGGRVVRLGELATIDESTAETRDVARYNGNPTVAIGVVKASGSNPVEVIKTVRTQVDTELAGILPPDVALTVVTDEARPIEAIVKALESHLIEGTLLTALIVWLFLKSVRATTIIATAIPVSLLGAIAVLYFAGYTFNSFTLLALLLLIGVVVDDAIVVLENIYKTKEHEPGLDIKTASEKGASEVLFAVMAATLTLVCVFGPVVFLPGVLGQYLQSFAVTVVVGVLVSWFVSMTLTPMLCSRYLKVNESEKGVYAWLESGFRRMEARYQRILDLCMRHRKLVLAAALATLLPAWLLLGMIETEFNPQVDEGRISVRLSLPSGHGKDKIEELALLAESQLADFQEVSGVLTTFDDGGRSGSDSLSLLVVLKDERELSQKELLDRFQKKFSGVPGWRANVQPAAGAGSTIVGGAPLQFYVQGPDYERLQELAQDMHTRLGALPGMQNLRNNVDNGLPQLTATIDKAEASRLGVASQDVSRTVAALNGQMTMGRYTAIDGERYDVVLRSDRGISPDSTDVLGQIKVRTRADALVPLSTVVRFEPEGAATSLRRVNQQFAVTFFGNPQISLGDAMAHVNQAGSELPQGYSISFAGQAEEMRKAGGSLVVVFGMAIVLLYLVLASQFNSYTQPLLIMLAQPLAVIGGIGALAATGQTLNIYSMIGLVLLVGLVAKNSILLVDRANQLVGAGMAIDDALRQACPERLRPVLMTSLTVMLAMLPAAMGFGAGSENNQPLSIAIIGGMASSTLLTLLVVPAAYSLFVRSPAGAVGAVDTQTAATPSQ